MNTTTELSGEKWDRWGQIASRAQQDPEFKKRLLAEPEAVVKEHGLDLPAGVQMALVETPDKGFQLTFSQGSDAGELSEDDLERVAGGYCNKSVEATLNKM